MEKASQLYIVRYSPAIVFELAQDLRDSKASDLNCSWVIPHQMMRSFEA